MMGIDRARTRRAGVAALAALLAAGGAAQAQIVAKYSTPTMNDSVHIGMKLLKKMVESRAGGRLRIDIYPASQLGAIPRVIEGTQLGTIEMATVPPEFLVGLDKRFGVLSAPGVFDDMMHGLRTVYDPEFRAAYWKLGENKGLHLFGIQCNAQAVYVSLRPIKRLTDFKGLKLRAFPSPMEREALKRLGATVAPMPLMEMVPGLQQGTIDGAKSGASVFVNFKVFNVAKYMLRTRDTLVCPIHFASKIWWDKLPGDLRKIIEEETAKVDLINQKASIVADEEAYRIWEKNGGTVSVLSAADQAELKRRMKTVGEAATADDPGSRAMYELMVKAAERTRGKT